MNGIYSLCKCGEFIPHIYRDNFIKTNIITTENSFRASDSYAHKEGEEVHIGQYLIISKCIHCDKESRSWCSPAMYEQMVNID